MRTLRVVGLALLPLAAPYGLQEMLKGNDPSKADLESWKGQYLSPEMGGQVDKAFAKHRGDILSTKAQLYKGFQSLSADIQGKSGEANAQLVTTLGSGSGREHATMIAAEPEPSEQHEEQHEHEHAELKVAASYSTVLMRTLPRGTTLRTSASQLTVLSYNLLADIYVRPIDTRTGAVQEFAAFRWAEPAEEVLAWEARQPRLLAELKESEAKAVELEGLYKEEQTLRKKYFNMMEDMKGKIRVFCRTRPMAQYELDRQCEPVVSFVDDTTIGIETARGPKQFMYDAIFTPQTSQEEVFADCRDLVTSAIDGYNITIFAYGQTGAGKTHTMHGSAADPGYPCLL